MLGTKNEFIRYCPCFSNMHKTLEKLLHSLGFICSVADALLCYRSFKEHVELIFFLIDDFILGTVPDKAKNFIDSVKRKFNMHYMRFPNKALSIQLIRDMKRIHFYKKKSEIKIIDELELKEAIEKKTLLLPYLKLPSVKEVPNTVVINYYRIVHKN